MKKTRVVMPLLSMLVSLAAVGCNGSASEPIPSSSSSSEILHQADGKYQSDETYHWQGCTANDNRVYLKGTHTYVENGSVKTCSVCGRNADYTKDDNVQAFLNARNKTMAYNGAFTSHTVVTGEDDDGTSRYDILESYDGDIRYFADNNASEKAGEEEVSYRQLLVFESAKNGDVDCGRLYTQVSVVSVGTNVTHKEAVYLSPDYMHTYEDFISLPSEIPESYYIGEGTDEESFLNSVRENAADDFGAEPTMSFARNNDGSVSFTYVVENTEEASEESEGTDKNVTTVKTTAQGGYISKVEVTQHTETTYEDTTKNSTKDQSIVIDISYTFDQEKYDAFDTTTETTKNNYKALFSIHFSEIPGYMMYYVGSYVGDTVTSKTLNDYLLSCVGRFVNFDGAENVFEFYTDEKRENLFTSVDTTEESYDVYLKFTPPEGKSVILTTEESEEDGVKKESLRIAYLWDANRRFYPRDMFKNYELLTVDGVVPTSYSSFVPKSGEVHVVKYSSEYQSTPPTVEHGALPEWSYSEDAHWHECNECANETFNWGTHNFVEQDGKSVCSVCGYVAGTTTEE